MYSVGYEVQRKSLETITFHLEQEMCYLRYPSIYYESYMRYLSTIAFTILVFYGVVGQSKENWNTLGMVTISNQYDADLGMEIQMPEVSMVTRQLGGKEIELAGFIIPLTGKLAQSHFMLSRYPQSMCFFCGKAGPETAIQVFMKDQKKVPFTEDKITVRGILRINATDMNNLLYTLDQAVIIDK